MIQLAVLLNAAPACAAPAPAAPARAAPAHATPALHVSDPVSQFRASCCVE